MNNYDETIIEPYYYEKFIVAENAIKTELENLLVGKLLSEYLGRVLSIKVTPSYGIYHPSIINSSPEGKKLAHIKGIMSPHHWFCVCIPQNSNRECDAVIRILLPEKSLATIILKHTEGLL